MFTILHITPTLEGGGAERQLSVLASEQARQGHDVHVALRRTGVHADWVAASGAKIHQLGDFRLAHPALLFAIRRIIKTAKPEIVQTWLPQMDIMGGIAALQARTPWIATERTAGVFYATIPVVARARLLLGHFAAAVVANSNIGERYWQENGSRKAKLVTIRNALDIDGIRRAACSSFERQSRPLFLVMGRLHRDKAIDIVVKAVAKLPDPNKIEVWIAGDGNEREIIKSEIESAGLNETIKLLPYQPEWWQSLRAASGLISMSRYEGNPNAVLEAMVGRCPVILSDIPGHREIADASTASFVPVDDPQGLADAIVALLNDADAAARRAERASDRVANWTTETMTKAYNTLYQDVLGRGI
ncbi:glycosyltransferase [Bradyrhizobium elkanii]